MNEESLAALKAKVALQERQLNLIEAIDHIRDTVPDPTTMLTGIINILADHLHIEYCLLSLIDQETGEPEMKTVHDRSQQLGPLGQAIGPDLVKRAINLDEIEIWEGDDVLPHLKLDYHIPRLQLVAVPIIMDHSERLGALLLARTLSTFGPDDLELLKTAESQIDSAIIQGYHHNELQQYVKELETIYRIDHIRDQSPTFDEMLNAVMQEVCHVINAEMGFTMLYDEGGKRLALRAATHHDLFQVSPYSKTISTLANQSLETGELICDNNIDNGLRSVLCLPLILNDKIIGVLGVANRFGPKGFTQDDRRLLSAIGSQMDTAIFESMEKRTHAAGFGPVGGSPHYGPTAGKPRC